MRDAIILASVTTVATASVVSALALIWLCVKANRVSDALMLTDQRNREAIDIVQCTVIDALAGVQEEIVAAKLATERALQRVNVATELGFQNAEAAERIEHAAAEVAHDLADSISRADAMPNDGNYGAAADAALRSPHEPSPMEES